MRGASRSCRARGAAVCLVRPGWGPASATNGVLLLGFLAHYANRALVYPLRIRAARRLRLVMGSPFTFTNGYLQAGARLGLGVSSAWRHGLRRRPPAARGPSATLTTRAAGSTPTGGAGYKVRSGLFDYVSGANYLCEISSGRVCYCCRACPYVRVVRVFNLGVAPRITAKSAATRIRLSEARRPFLFTRRPPPTM